MDVLFPNSFSRQAALYSLYVGPEGQNRKIVKNGSLQIEAPEPIRAAEQIQKIAKGLGGEIFKSNLANRCELQYLTHQIEMSALDITILGEERFGPISLHPLYRIRLAFHSAISSVIDFAAAMITIVAYLPAALLWTVSLFVLAAFAWRILRWLWKLLIFKPAKQIAA